jgi:hypothetical protein
MQAETGIGEGKCVPGQPTFKSARLVGYSPDCYETLGLKEQYQVS